MRFFISIKNKMRKFANKKYIIVMFVLFIILVGIMEISPIGAPKLKQLSGGTGMLDMEFGYGQISCYKMFDAIGAGGRQLYTNLLGLDFIFAIVFMLLQSLIITALIKKAELSRYFELFNILPVVRSGLDMIENCFILTLLFRYPTKLPSMVGISSAITISKWIVFTMIITLIILLCVWAVWKSVMKKRRRSEAI